MPLCVAAALCQRWANLLPLQQQARPAASQLRLRLLGARLWPSSCLSSRAAGSIACNGGRAHCCLGYRCRCGGVLRVDLEQQLHFIVSL